MLERRPGWRRSKDDDEDDDCRHGTAASNSVKVADLKLELGKRNLKAAKKQNFVDRLLVELKRERKSAMMTFGNDDGNGLGLRVGRENSSNRNNGVRVRVRTMRDRVRVKG